MIKQNHAASRTGSEILAAQCFSPISPSADHPSANLSWDKSLLLQVSSLGRRRTWSLEMLSTVW